MFIILWCNSSCLAASDTWLQLPQLFSLVAVTMPTSLMGEWLLGLLQTPFAGRKIPFLMLSYAGEFLMPPNVVR